MSMRNHSGGDGGGDYHQKDQKDKQRLPEIISQWYYKHGLFLSSYPTCAASIAIMAILLCCYPLLNIPLPGTIPTKVVLPYEGKYSLFGENTRQKYGGDNYGSSSSSSSSSTEDYKNYSSIVKNMFKVHNYSLYDPPFAWAHSSPMVYVQQIMLRTSVFPWTDDMNLMDAFRSPMYEVFKLLEIVRNHETEESKITLDNICLHVENIKRPHNEQIFPEYNCLVLSPANIWGQNIQNFTKDTNILNTVFTHHNIQKTKVSAAEMLFGLPMQDTGFKRYPLRSRSRVIQYAITLILNNNDMEYLNSLKSKLTKLYPLHQRSNQKEKDEQVSSIMYIYYPGEFRFMEFLPICTALVLLFTYIYFSVRKIDVIRSRVVLAICSVITVLGSLTMSLGLCFFFGLTISLQSKEIFPYLVILIGLENCLVITKSVVSTDETFDVKIRVAQALSKEGWHISKTLLTEITILTIGLATFVPVIQEFCVFAIVGLISDFMLQMLLFSTILAMNIRQVEYTQEAKHIPKMMMMMTQVNDGKKNEFKYFSHAPFHRSHSHPKLAFGDFSLNSGDSFNKRTSLTNDNQRQIPKRIKIVNFWARTRLFQRAFMIWMVVWICSIIYSSGFLQSFIVVDMNHSKTAQTEDVTLKAAESVTEKAKIDDLPFRNLNNFEDSSNITDQLKKLRYPGFELNYYLSSFHWSSILKQYNISLSGRYVTILPAIKLSHVIKPEVAVLLRNPQEKLIQNFQWKALAAALDPLDLIDDDNRESPLITTGGTPLVPKSPMEIILAIMLCAISVSVLCYTMVVFYRCICTRNYAEWRSSWNEPELLHPSGGEQILEGIPLQIDGHTHKIECLISDGSNIVSSCLKGQIKVWDAKFGDHIATIDRANMQIAEYDERVEGEDKQLFFKKKSTSPIWCLDFLDNLIAVGCANGRMEFWETPSGALKCAYQEEDKRSQGVTHIHLTGDRVIVARLSGKLNFYRLETYYKGKQIDWGFTSAYRRTHVRTGSTGSIGMTQPGPNTAREEMKCTLEGVRNAHQQPITCMEVVNGMVFTGSQDHTLKVYSVDNPTVEYTLHGHCSPITCLFVDRFQSGTGGSGSQNGLLCVWDLLTGVCMYNIQAHDGAITALACAPSYVISLGIDERVCVWERFQGNLLSAINISNAYSNLLMLTPSLLVTCKLGSLMVWDVRTSEPAREVKLDCSNSQLSPKIMRIASNSVICDYGNQIRIVKFPIVADKCN